MPKVAVVGAGIAGLAAAHALARHAAVTLFEAGTHFGGHAQTIDVTLEGITHGVDTGFLVFNERTYPRLIALFEELGVASHLCEMSFSVQLPAEGLAWSGSNLNSVFAQRRNLLRPRFWRMLREILRFNALTTDLARREAEAELRMPIGEFLDRHGFSKEFRGWYFLPMIACIWSCPTDDMLRFPIATLIRFCHNHGLLQINGRPPWRSVLGGSREYVRRMLPAIADARLNTAVRAVQPRHGSPGVELHTDHRSECFDAVVLACHADQALALLADVRPDEQALLGAIRYHPNRAVLHTDASLLPPRRRAWAAWNYERATHGAQEQSAVCLHYLINRLQRLPWQTPTLVSLNPVRQPRPDSVLGEWNFAHPVFDEAAIAAQRRLHEIQGRRGLWFCGAWTRYGFHEDGLTSGLAVAQDIVARWARVDQQQAAA
jgi:predicted NAD/FAD-binding protein